MAAIERALGRHVAVFAALLMLGLPPPASAVQAVEESFCAERIDDNQYIILQVARSGIGRGIDRVYPVELRAARVRTAEQAEAYKTFNFYRGLDDFGEPFSDKRKYVFDDDDRGERLLFKHVNGRPRQRVTLYKIEFSRSRLPEIRQSLRANDRALYDELGIATRLEALGVMGVIYRGGRGTVDFVNSLALARADGTPGLMARNADAMLYRYALAQQLEGVSDVIEGSELGTNRAFATVLRKQGEKALLNGRLPGGQTSYYEEIMKGAAKPADHEWSLNQPLLSAGNSLPTLESKDFEWRYAPCVPKGDAQWQAKAVVVPQKENGRYPVIVYPGAFADLDTLRMALERAYAQAWSWRGVLDLGEADAVEREYLLRLPAPDWLWLAIRSAREVNKNSSDKRGVEKIMDENAMGRPLMQGALDRLVMLRRAIEGTGDGDLPGVPDAALIQPWRPSAAASDLAGRASAERHYAQAMQILAGNAVIAPPSPPKALSSNGLKQLRSELLQAIAQGYTRSRNQLNVDLNEPWRSKPGFSYDDLEWLYTFLEARKAALGSSPNPLLDALKVLSDNRRGSMAWGTIDPNGPMPLEDLVKEARSNQEARLSGLRTQLKEQSKQEKNLLGFETDVAEVTAQIDSAQTALAWRASADTDEKLAAGKVYEAWRSLDSAEMKVTSERQRLGILTQEKARPRPEYRALASEFKTRADFVVAALDDFIDGGAKGDYPTLKARLTKAGMTMEGQP